MTIVHRSGYEQWLRQRGVGDNDRTRSSQVSYVSYLNGVSRLLGQDVSPRLLSSEADVERIIASIAGHRARKTIQNYQSAMRQYVAMVQAGACPADRPVPSAAHEVGEVALAEYARIPSTVNVRRVLEVTVADGGLGGFVLSERAADAPYVKDYDALDGGPARWAARFDVSRWRLLGARIDGRLVGGAAVVADDPAIHVLEGRGDLAVLWDIRVAPDARGRGVGAALFAAAEAWAADRGCRQLKVETQNVNLPACRFYARLGCALGAIHRFAYPELPHEAQLLWYRNLRT